MPYVQIALMAVVDTHNLAINASNSPNLQLLASDICRSVPSVDFPSILTDSTARLL